MRDRERWVATLATEPRSITVPGPGGTTVDVAADALTAVTVAATHRRRGLLRQMITQSLQAAADRGDALAILIAAEWPIYGRYGYAPATRSAQLHLLPAARRRDGAPPIRPVPCARSSRPSSASTHGAIFDGARRRWAGQVDRSDAWWAQRLGLDGYEPILSRRGTWIVHEGADGPDGLLAWKVTRDFELTANSARSRCSSSRRRPTSRTATCGPTCPVST